VGAEVDLELKISMDKVAAAKEFGELANELRKQMAKQGTIIDIKEAKKLLKQLQREQVNIYFENLATLYTLIDKQLKYEEDQRKRIEKERQRRALENLSKQAAFMETLLKMNDAKNKERIRQDIELGNKAERGIRDWAKKASKIDVVKTTEMKPGPATFEVGGGKKKPVDWLERKPGVKYKLDEEKIAKPPVKGGVMGAIKTGLGDAAVAGGVAGLAAGGILALVGVMGDVAKRSQILSNIMNLVGSILGLLVDLVLLPFLPLIVAGIMWLVKIILWLGAIWNAFWKDETVQAIVKGIKDLVEALAKGVKWVLDLVFALPESLAKLWEKILSGDPVSIVIGLLLAAAAYEILAWLLPLLAGSKVVTVAMSILAPVLSAFMMWLTGLFMTSPFIAWGITIGIGLVLGSVVVELLNLLGILGGISDLGEGFRANAKKWFEGLPGPIKVVVDALYNFLKVLTDILNLLPGLNFLTPNKMSQIISQGAYNADVMAKLREKNPGKNVSFSADKGYTVDGVKVTSFAVGGIIPGIPNSPQIVMAHGGEEIIPTHNVGRTPAQAVKEEVTNVNNNFNFYGFNDDALVRKVHDIVRKQGAGYKL
jgi:hypothetical protein